MVDPVLFFSLGRPSSLGGPSQEKHTQAEIYGAEMRLVKAAPSTFLTAQPKEATSKGATEVEKGTAKKTLNPDQGACCSAIPIASRGPQWATAPCEEQSGQYSNGDLFDKALAHPAGCSVACGGWHCGQYVHVAASLLTVR